MTPMPMGEAFTWLAGRAPARVAVRCGAEVLTRRELDERADALAREWVAAGVVADAVVAVCLPTSIDLVVACVAAWKAGATPLPLSPALPADERARLLEVAQPWTVVDAPLPAPAPAPPLPAGLAASSWKIATSSGSTGLPKLVRAAAPATVDPMRRVTLFLPVDAVQLVSAPLSHGAPFVYAMRGLMTGHELVLLPDFAAETWLDVVARHGVTWAMLSPASMLAIWRSGAREATDVSSLATVVHLGAPCPPWLKRAWLGWLGPERVTEVYAGTESQGIAVIDGVEWLAHPGSVGRGVGGTEFRIGEGGEVLMRRGHPTFSYLGGVADGSRAVPHEGWHSLGDVGRLDADGYLYLDGRRDDVVHVDGEPVHPAPLEAALEEHPSVRSALVVGRSGEGAPRLHAVVDDAGTGLTPDVLADWLDTRLAPGPRPHTYEIVDRLLRDAAGKARRRDWR